MGIPNRVASPITKQSDSASMNISLIVAVVLVSCYVVLAYPDDSEQGVLLRSLAKRSAGPDAEAIAGYGHHGYGHRLYYGYGHGHGHGHRYYGHGYGHGLYGHGYGHGLYGHRYGHGYYGHGYGHGHGHYRYYG